MIDLKKKINLKKEVNETKQLNTLVLCVYKKFLKYDTNGNSIYQYVFITKNYQTFDIKLKNDYIIGKTYIIIDWHYDNRNNLKYKKVVECKNKNLGIMQTMWSSESGTLEEGYI